ncbi:DUF3300 domain-containing protein [Paracoccus benzoatiresistens]|uniref:DUF3300 domain-containing protein n=1 Tax=Paracoccus benzoatiresistens TaxID=2997341 RepID=A0ABT4JAH7_9RHOB|nr:DUF3300 domain-containing protein [Paracoccus sp. EF6]MCZ0963476.1 DUF3300 domain-containing protein [Paracoccus sp. EF6]
MMNAHEPLHSPAFRRLCAAALAGLAVGAVAGSPPGPALAQTGSVACGGEHVVASGDTLSKLAESAYGDPALYGVIADANDAALGGDPSRIFVGMSLTIPCLDASGQAGTPGQAPTLQSAVAAEGELSPDQLDALFGPVALFPDTVLTPVLVAVTFPLDVVKAARFVEENSGLSDKDRAQKAAAEPWDDSVRELAAGFPDLITRMNDHLDWTEQAGEAVVAQTDDVLASIQRLRAKAQGNGYLEDNAAQTVETVDNRIVINPAVPNVVQLPVYDSQVVYSSPAPAAPVYHYGYDYGDDWVGWGDALVAGGIVLGSAVILDEIFDDDDWDGWGDNDEIDWDRGDISINRGDRNVERGDINIEGGERNIERGDRVSIGESDRIQVDRDANRAALADRARETGATRPAARQPISNSANRELARQKIETRKAQGASPARLDATRKAASRPQAARAATRPAGASAATRSAPRATTQRVSRPTAQKAPQARSPSRSSNAFHKSSGSSRASLSSSRGRSSMGAQGGGRGGGGRGGGRR